MLDSAALACSSQRIVHQPRANDWGHTLRNIYSRRAKGDRVLHIDDDDVYLDGAMDLVRFECAKHPGQLVVFGMLLPGGQIPRDHQIRFGNIGISNKPIRMLQVYTLTWNEIEIIEWFLAHYGTIADRIIVYDGGSTDGTREAVAACPKAELIDLESEGKLRDDLHIEVKNNAWRGRGADWVICVDCDEFLFSPAAPLAEALGRLEAAQIAVPRTTGVSMFSETFPAYCQGQQLYGHITHGVRDDHYSKCVLFSPRRVDRMGYHYGAHTCQPSLHGAGVEPSAPDPPLYLLHFKHIGGWDRVLRRHQTAASRLSEVNRRLGLGTGNLGSLPQEYARSRDYCGPVPGLGGAALEEGPAFQQDWVSSHEAIWRRVLAEMIGKEGLHFLEVGTFEGRAAVWFLQHVLTGRSSRLTVIDTFEGGQDQRDFGVDVSNLRARFDRNLRPFRGRVTVRVGHSHQVLRQLPWNEFDAAYLDSSYIAADVLEEAVLTWRLLRPGGILIFDDYGWDLYRDSRRSPGPGIDAFLAGFAGQYNVLHKEYQVILRKL